MKTKMMKKLISVVCAAAMATSCAAISVGAAPIVISQADWIQGYSRAIDLNYLVHSVGDNGHSFNECADLADKLEEFFNGAVCTEAVYGSQDLHQNDFAGNVNYVLTHLRSHDIEQRRLGTGAAVDNLHDIAVCIGTHIH